MKKINKILAANRSEIAIRIFRAAEESGIRTAAVYSKEDRFALHRFKTDESYLLSGDKGPIQAYLDIPSIIKIAKKAKVGVGVGNCVQYLILIYFPLIAGGGTFWIYGKMISFNLEVLILLWVLDVKKKLANI